MKKLLLILASAMLSITAFAQVKPETRKELQARYDEFADAYAKEDIERIGKMVGKDFTEGEGENKLNRETFLKAIKAGFDRSNFENPVIKILTAEPKGDAIVVVIIEELTVINPADTSKKFRFKQVTKDTWVKEDGVWVVSAVETIGHEVER